jgi:methylated-DNA-[protein]-cysteine S-methyltransferase
MQINYPSPIGALTVSVNNGFIKAVTFTSEKRPANPPADNPTKADSAICEEAIRQLDEYFTGKRKAFDLPLAPDGTEFQKKVWQALLAIPYGETRSYRDIAEAIDCPKGCRAVGMANNRNPICIIIPCHRVIGADGSMVGYGSGIERKVFLLNLEKYSN